MKIKVITKSGREYNHEGCKIITRYDENDFKIYTYASIDTYYNGDGAYRDKDLILLINKHCIESVDYRVDNEEQ